MNIKADLKNVLAESGWSASRLAAAAGVSAPVVTRFLSGARAGLHSSTLEKLWPFIYGDKRPNPEQAPKEAA
jgi:DNA-binding Xre family transcriptional regulator